MTSKLASLSVSACGNCRKSHAKCDSICPQCGGCARRCLDCPGPPVRGNSTIAARNQGSTKQTASSSRSGTSDHTYQEPILDWLTSTPNMYSNSRLGPSWSEATYDTYVEWLLRHARESRLTPPFMAIADCLNQGGGHRATHLQSAISAISLQTRALEQPDLNIPYCHAMESYSRAIKSLHCALYDDKEAISSESLVSVMILSLYALQATDPFAFDHYNGHIDGIIGMLRAGRESWQTCEHSQTLNYGIRYTVLLNYLLRGMTVPAELKEEEGFFGKTQDVVPNIYYMHTLGVRLAAVRGRAHALPTMELADVEEHLKETQDVHIALKQWYAQTHKDPISTGSNSWEVHVNITAEPVPTCDLCWYRIFQILTLDTAKQFLERKITLQDKERESLGFLVRFQLASIESSLRQQIVAICVCVYPYSRSDGVGLTNDQAIPRGFLISHGWVIQSTMLSLSKGLDDNGQSEWLLTRIKKIMGTNSRVFDRLRYVQQSMSKPPSEVG